MDRLEATGPRGRFASQSTRGARAWTRRAGLIAALSAGGAALAQSPAPRPLRLVVPFAPGGAADVFARAFGPVVAASLGQTAVVENLGGGATRPGTAAVIRAAPDGQTLLVTNDTLAAIEALPLAGTGSYLAGLAPVLLAASAPMVLVTHPRSGIADATGYATRLRSGPPPNVGVPGLGSTQHFASEMLAQAIGGGVQHVPYRGAGPMLTDLLAGTIDAAMIILGSVVGQIRGGQLVALGVTSERRSPVAADVPAFAEGIAPGFSADTWIGVFAPAATPAPTIASLADAGTAALRDPALAQRLAGLGFATPGLGPDRFAPLLRENVARFAALARRAGLRAEDM